MTKRAFTVSLSTWNYIICNVYVFHWISMRIIWCVLWNQKQLCMSFTDGGVDIKFMEEVV